MVSGIIPIWVTYYAIDILKMENAKVLNCHDEKYHIYDHEFGSYIRDEKQRRKRGIFYAIIIGFVFISIVLIIVYIIVVSSIMWVKDGMKK